MATGNVVKENYLKDNEFDIQVFSAGNGTGNVAKNVSLMRNKAQTGTNLLTTQNKCKLGFPAEACIS